MNIDLSSQIIETNTTTYADGDPSPWFGIETKCGGAKSVHGIQLCPSILKQIGYPL